MKHIVVLVFFASLFSSCLAQKPKDKVQQIIYEAFTRGSKKEILVSGNIVSVAINSSKNKESTISNKRQKKLLEIIDKIDLSNIHNLKAPSEKRLHDGALHTTIIIKTLTKTYTSTTFDDGNPPKELKELEKELLKIGSIEN